MNRAKCCSSSKDCSNNSCIITVGNRGRNLIGNQLARKFVRITRLKENLNNLKFYFWGRGITRKSLLTPLTKLFISLGITSGHLAFLNAQFMLDFLGLDLLVIWLPINSIFQEISVTTQYHVWMKVDNFPFGNKSWEYFLKKSFFYGKKLKCWKSLTLPWMCTNNSGSVYIYIYIICCDSRKKIWQI